jgi:hypothetical protein
VIEENASTVNEVLNNNNKPFKIKDFNENNSISTNTAEIPHSKI